MEAVKSYERFTCPWCAKRSVATLHIWRRHQVSLTSFVSQGGVSADGVTYRRCHLDGLRFASAAAGARHVFGAHSDVWEVTRRAVVRLRRPILEDVPETIPDDIVEAVPEGIGDIVEEITEAVTEAVDAAMEAEDEDAPPQLGFLDYICKRLLAAEQRLVETQGTLVEVQAELVTKQAELDRTRRLLGALNSDRVSVEARAVYADYRAGR
jgi:hypothetical protein